MNATVLLLLMAVGQCVDDSCGIGVGAGVNIGRLGVGAQVEIGLRPRGEKLSSPAMCLINGGLGVHLGNGVVLSCGHGEQGPCVYKGVTYQTQVLYINYSGRGGNQNINDAGGDISILRVNAPFDHKVHLAASEPQPGTRVYWQGGAGTVKSYSGPWMWVNGRCRSGDSGSPVWNEQGKVVGVVTATNGYEVVVTRLNIIVSAVAAAGVSLEGKPQGSPALEPLPRLEDPDAKERDTLKDDIAALQDRVKELLAERGKATDIPSGELPEPVDEPEAVIPSDIEQPIIPDNAGGDGASVMDGVPWASVATWALGAAGVGAGTMGGGWAAWLALLAARRVVSKLRKKDEPAAPQAEQPRTRPVVVDETLREKLVECSEERSKLEAQVSTLKTRVQELEDEHRQHVIAYTDTYKRAVELANAALHRKDPDRWRQFIPGWLAMVDQYHSAVREEKRHAGNSSVYV